MACIPPETNSKSHWKLVAKGDDSFLLGCFGLVPEVNSLSALGRVFDIHTKMMVCWMYLLSDTAVLGIHVKFQGGVYYLFQLSPQKIFQSAAKKPSGNCHRISQQEDPTNLSLCFFVLKELRKCWKKWSCNTYMLYAYICVCNIVNIINTCDANHLLVDVS